MKKKTTDILAIVGCLSGKVGGWSVQVGWFLSRFFVLREARRERR